MNPYVYPADSYRSLFPGFPGTGGFPGGGPGGFPGGGPGGFPGGGPGGFPGGGPGFPPPAPGGPGGPPPAPQGGAPQSPPPAFTPQLAPSVMAVDPGSIRRCLYRYVYILQDNGEQYWVYLTFVGRRSLAGYRWYGFGPYGYWVYFGLDLHRVNQFYCYG
ncbi:hypothetical protein [Paenibacillus silviterrae]|uniref:hypothetical protein n=1 Tax=Paenibacillus silviterrae TaxID=3242194 RepID=UPI002542C56D|nr:hypothetical protein [Paenibacillus chinjuensis]